MSKQIFTLEDLESAMKRAGTPVGEGNDIIHELTKPTQVFEVGQVVWRDDYKFYDYWDNAIPPNNLPLRALNQTEVGPDWVPREAVEGLKIHAERAKQAMEESRNRHAHEILLGLISAFDRAIGESDD